MEIEYDSNKNDENIKARGIDFGRFVEMDFATARYQEDTRKQYPERRYVFTGTIDGRLHVGCVALISGGFRVISLRKANKREVKNHE